MLRRVNWCRHQFDILVDAGTLFEYVCARPHKLIDVNIYLSTWTTKHGDDNNNSA